MTPLLLMGGDNLIHNTMSKKKNEHKEMRTSVRAQKEEQQAKRIVAFVGAALILLAVLSIVVFSVVM